MSGKTITAVWFIALMMLAPATVQATQVGLGFDISPSLVTTNPGGTYSPTCDNATLYCVIFSGTITPDPLNDVFITGIEITFSPSVSEIMNIDNFFFDAANSPGFVMSIDPPYSGPIFALEVANTVPAGIYQGTAILYGTVGPPDPFTPSSQLASAQFSVQVVPEPSSIALMVLGIAGLLAKHRRRK